MNTKINPDHVPFSWKLLLSGYVPEYLYDLHAIDTSVSFAELQQMSHINSRAQLTDKDLDFSNRIRTTD